MKDKMKVDFIPKAISDIDEIKKWYNNEKEGLGDEFTKKIEKTINNLGVFHECQVQGFFVILELKFTSVNEYFKISKVTKKLALVKNAII